LQGFLRSRMNILEISVIPSSTGQPFPAELARRKKKHEGRERREENGSAKIEKSR